VLPIVTPAALLRIPRPFDHPDFVYEVKYDGFRVGCRLGNPRCPA
jgi:ATP-dependent DNA ligase